MTRALVCSRCGAPLPSPDPSGAFTRCVYCGTTLDVSGATARSIERHRPSDEEAERLRESRKGFLLALADDLRAGRPAYEALRDGAARHLGAIGESDVLARVVLVLAREFEAETGASITQDANALARVAEAYFAGLATIAEAGECTLNLPFLAATGAGPQHMSRRLTAADVAELVTRYDAPAGATIPKAGGGEPERKKPWYWPF